MVGDEHFRRLLIMFLHNFYPQLYETNVSGFLAARLWSSRLLLFLW